MFISSKKCFEIREGDQKLVIPHDFIGEIPDWAAGHWLVQAAIRDGSIATPDSTADLALEAADQKAREKAEEHDPRPDDGGHVTNEEETGKRARKQSEGTEKK